MVSLYKTKFSFQNDSFYDDGVHFVWRSWKNRKLIRQGFNLPFKKEIILLKNKTNFRGSLWMYSSFRLFMRIEENRIPVIFISLNFSN